MTRRKIIGGIETGDSLRPRDESGGGLLTGQVVSGVEVARAWSGLLHGTWDPVVPSPRAACGAVLARGCWWKRGSRAAESVRGELVLRGTGADRPVVAVMPGNAGGAKGTGRPGWPAGQPPWVGGAGRASRGRSRLLFPSGPFGKPGWRAGAKKGAPG